MSHDISINIVNTMTFYEIQKTKASKQMGTRKGPSRELSEGLNELPEGLNELPEGSKELLEGQKELLKK